MRSLSFLTTSDSFSGPYSFTFWLASSAGDVDRGHSRFAEWRYLNWCFLRYALPNAQRATKAIAPHEDLAVRRDETTVARAQ